MIDLSNLHKHANVSNSQPFIKVRSPKFRRYIIAYDPYQPQEDKDKGITCALVYDTLDDYKVVCRSRSAKKTFDELADSLSKYYKERTIIFPETEKH